MKIRFLILTMAIIVASISNVSSNVSGYPIIKRSTEGGFGNLYNYTEKKLVDFTWTTGTGATAHMLGWSISCAGIGFSWCPKSGGIILSTPDSRGIDAVDDAKGEELITYAQEQFGNNVNTGSHSIFVQVQGETTLRVYTVTWSYNATTDTYNTAVDRNDVTI